ncbi:MAG: D-alanine--D-alanine ligase [Lachnospiraceae bacterium]|nr:D-alanine--D-alanine ligase [Ruminococcus sp.]MCM1276874.1 D-alanine--D-alanine ligase [Lachnospiraceae bacterium]
MKKNIAVIFGGTSSEYTVSLQSAAAVLENFPDKYNAVPIWITQQGEWFYFWGNTEQIRADKLDKNFERASISPSRKSKCLITDNLKISIDAAFPVMHGMGGEDGTLQGFLELAGIPICGCGVLPSAVCMDKDRAHRLASTAGIAVPKAVSFTDLNDIIPNEIEAEISFPAYIKPMRGGSSFGISKVNSADDLIRAARKAFEFDSEIIIEQEIKGREVGCAVIGHNDLIIGEVDMIELTGEFFDYAEKYTPKTSRIFCPAPVSQDVASLIKDTARTIYKTLGCCGFARVDMFLCENGEIVFNEVNTIPGFTEHSRFPSMMKAAGYTLKQTIEMIINKAVKKYENK